MCFSGHDPTGGAGLQADIEAIAAQGAHACTVITALTIQDSHNLTSLTPLSGEQIQASAIPVLDDCTASTFKIGLLGSVDAVMAVAQLITDYQPLRVVLDPVLAAGGGTDVANNDLIAAINDWLLPLTSIITPNTEEAQRLTGQQSLADCAKALLNRGCQSVLITGTETAQKQQHDTVTHRLFNPSSVELINQACLNGHYHGSGCTLAAAIAAQLALGQTLHNAVTRALDYTHTCLQSAHQPGQGQAFPNRIVPLS